MSFIFWGITLTMLVAAIGAVIVPLRLARASGCRLSIALLVLVPAIAVGFYAGLGTPNAATREIAHQHQTRTATGAVAEIRSAQSVGSVASMLDGLKERLENEPDDAGSWLLLAKSYQHLGQNDNANAAYERARALGLTDAAFEQSTNDFATTAAQKPNDTGPALRGRVTLSPSAAALVAPGDTVFVFAKESADQRMPVFALRKPASELPIQFVLSDRDAMVPGTSIAEYEHLLVTAKISRSGLATEVLAGLETWSDPVSPRDGQLIKLQLTANSDAGSDRDE